MYTNYQPSQQHMTNEGVMSASHQVPSGGVFSVSPKVFASNSLAASVAARLTTSAMTATGAVASVTVPQATASNSAGNNSAPTNQFNMTLVSRPRVFQHVIPAGGVNVVSNNNMTSSINNPSSMMPYRLPLNTTAIPVQGISGFGAQPVTNSSSVSTSITPPNSMSASSSPVQVKHNIHHSTMGNLPNNAFAARTISTTSLSALSSSGTAATTVVGSSSNQYFPPSPGSTAESAGSSSIRPQSIPSAHQMQQQKNGVVAAIASRQFGRLINPTSSARSLISQQTSSHVHFASPVLDQTQYQLHAQPHPHSLQQMQTHYGQHHGFHPTSGMRHINSALGVARGVSPHPLESRPDLEVCQADDINNGNEDNDNCDDDNEIDNDDNGDAAANDDDDEDLNSEQYYEGGSVGSTPAHSRPSSSRRQQRNGLNQKSQTKDAQTMRRTSSYSSLASSASTSWSSSSSFLGKKASSPAQLQASLQSLEVGSNQSASQLQLVSSGQQPASDKRAQRTLCQVELNILTRLYCEGASTSFVARVLDVSERTIQRKFKELTDQKRNIEQHQQQNQEKQMHNSGLQSRRNTSSNSLSSMVSDSSVSKTSITQAAEEGETYRGGQSVSDNGEDESSQISSSAMMNATEMPTLSLQQRKRGRARKDYREIDMIMRSLYLQNPLIGGKEVREILMRDYNIAIALTQVYDRKKVLREDPTFVVAHNAALIALNSGTTTTFSESPEDGTRLPYPEFGGRMRITRSMNSMMESSQQSSGEDQYPKRVAVDSSVAAI